MSLQYCFNSLLILISTFAAFTYGQSLAIDDKRRIPENFLQLKVPATTLGTSTAIDEVITIPIDSFRAMDYWYGSRHRKRSLLSLTPMTEDIINDSRSKRSAQTGDYNAIIRQSFANQQQKSDGEGRKRRTSQSFANWAGKRASGEPFANWGGKRAANSFNTWGGKRTANSFNTWGGKRNNNAELDNRLYDRYNANYYEYYR